MRYYRVTLLLCCKEKRGSLAYTANSTARCRLSDRFQLNIALFLSVGLLWPHVSGMTL